jgi:putative endonuclease
VVEEVALATVSKPPPADGWRSPVVEEVALATVSKPAPADGWRSPVVEEVALATVSKPPHLSRLSTGDICSVAVTNGVPEGDHMAWTYLLECSDGSYYVGSTLDLERRVAQHEAGEGAAYTRRRRPLRLVWAAEFDRIDQAFWFEKQVQGWNRRKRKALIEGNWDSLPQLASRSWAARRARE